MMRWLLIFGLCILLVGCGSDVVEKDGKIDITYAKLVALTLQKNNTNYGTITWNGSHFDYTGNVTLGAKLLFERMNEMSVNNCECKVR